VALGNAAMMREMGLDTGAAEAKADTLRAEGKTAMFIAVDGMLAASWRWPTRSRTHRAGDPGTARPRAARDHGDRRQRTHGAGGGGQAPCWPPPVFTFAAGIFTVLSLVEKPVWSLMRDPMSQRADDRMVRDIHAQLRRVIHLLPPTMMVTMGRRTRLTVRCRTRSS
jgi:hypothetical protein